MAPIWLNGQIRPEEELCLSPLDRGFTLADGVFETIRARGSTPLWLADHLARLAIGADRLGIPLPFDDRAIGAAIIELLGMAGHAESAVRVTLTRGPSARRGLWPPGDPVRPTLMITVAPLIPLPPQRFIVARTTRRNEHSPLSRIKSLNYGDNLLARREAMDRGAGDALMLNGRGNLACGTIGNVFLQIDGSWMTPSLSEGVLPGLARARLLAHLGAAEFVIPEYALARASAAFVSNSLGCAAIIALEGRALPDLSAELDLASLYAT